MEITKKVDLDTWRAEGKCIGCWSEISMSKSDLTMSVVYYTYAKFYKITTNCPVCNYVLTVDENNVPLVIRDQMEAKLNKELKEKEDNYYNSLTWFGKIRYNLTK